MRLAIRLVALGALVCLSACTHSMTIVNRREYEGISSVSAQKSLRFAVETDVTAEDTKDLVEAVKEALAASSSVERVAFANEAPPDFKPDYIVRIRPATEYAGSGWNYAITFPGFLIFTHAWNGFVYGADVDTDIEIRTLGIDRAFASQTVQTHWNLRHCDFERGAWTSSGWYTPFYGGINLIIGFFMIRYDQDATPAFVTEVHKPYGRYVAAKVLELTAKIPAVSAPPPSVSVAPTPSAAP
jgi:hypothetical protein